MASLARGAVFLRVAVFVLRGGSVLEGQVKPNAANGSLMRVLAVAARKRKVEPNSIYTADASEIGSLVVHGGSQWFTK